MEKAYVLIEAQVGKTKEVVEAIRKLQGVASVALPLGKLISRKGGQEVCYS